MSGKGLSRRESSHKEAPSDESVSASEFKARCLALLDQVNITGRPLIVTKHGRPVARVVPIDDAAAKSMFGSVTLLSDRDEDYFSAGEAWEAEGKPGRSR